MNVALAYNDQPRYFTVGTFLTKVLCQRSEINIVAHSRVPEDTGIFEEQCGLNIDLIIIVDSGTHFKLHHHKGLLGKAKTCFWISDLHRKDWAAWRLMMIKEFKYDHVFYAQKNFKQQVLDCGYTEDQCSWLPHATDPEIFKSMSSIEKKYDIGFVGFSNQKRDAIDKILKEFCNYKQFATVWSWFAARCMNELKIGLNVPVEDDLLNMRFFETMSVGIPLLVEKVVDNGVEDLFEEDKDFMTFSNNDELKDKVKLLLENSELRKTLADSAMSKVLQKHTYRHRVNTILSTMGFETL